MKQIDFKNITIYALLFIIALFPIGCARNKLLFPNQIITATNINEKQDASSFEGLSSETINWETINLRAKGIAQPEQSLSPIERTIFAKREAHTQALKNLSKTLSLITLSNNETLGKYLLNNPDARAKTDEILLNARIDSVDVTKDGSMVEKVSLNLKPLSGIISLKPSRAQKILQNRTLESVRMFEERTAENAALSNLLNSVLEYKVNKKESVMDLIVDNKLERDALKNIITLTHTTKTKHINDKVIVEVEFNLGNINTLLKK